MTPPPRAVILSAYVVDLREAGRRLLRIQAGLLEQVLVVEQGRDVGVQRDAVQPVVECRDGLVARADVRQLRPVLGLIGDVDQLTGVLELRGVDQVHAHQVRDVARRDALGELRHHLGVDDVAQVDRLGRVRLVPGADEDVDHPLVAAGALPHLHRVRVFALGAVLGGLRRRGRGRGARAAEAAGAAAVLEAGGAEAPPPAALGALDDVLELQAAMTRMTTIARVGSLRWVLIQSPPIVQIIGDRPLCRCSNTLGWRHSIMSAIEFIHSISRPGGRAR